MGRRKLISVVTHCYNEQNNIEEAYRQVRTLFAGLSYEYEHLFIDNASTDGTADVLRSIASTDRNVKVIINTRNFGVIRSGQHGLLQANGDAVISLAADLEDPPELILEFLRKWEEGFKVVKGIKTGSQENLLMSAVRGFYYHLSSKLSDVPVDRHFHGYALYDREVIEAVRAFDDPYPYLRGLIAELGYASARVFYTKGRRAHGKTSYNFYRLYDEAILGITSHSRVPLRIATISGFVISLFCFLFGMSYLIAKLVFWQTFPIGIAPIIVSVLFLFSVILFFIGILGEYIGFIHMRILKRPLVVEKERLNFENIYDDPRGPAASELSRK